MTRIYTTEQKARKKAAQAAYYQRTKHAADVDAQRERQRVWKRANPEKVRAYQLKHQPTATAKQYGLTVAAVEALFANQSGRCGVCDKPLKPWPNRCTHVDHDHTTGAVRGILCSSCNRYEGWMRRHGARLQAYLDAPPARDLLDIA